MWYKNWNILLNSSSTNKKLPNIEIIIRIYSIEISEQTEKKINKSGLCFKYID